MMQPLALGLTKLSFLFFYRRIFLSGNPRSPFGIATVFTICIIAAWMVSFFFAWVFVCGKHPSIYWYSLKASSAHCFETRKAIHGFAISDLLTDLMVFILPIPMVGHCGLELIVEVRHTLTYSGRCCSSTCQPAGKWPYFLFSASAPCMHVNVVCFTLSNGADRATWASVLRLYIFVTPPQGKLGCNDYRPCTNFDSGDGKKGTDYDGE